MGRRGPRSMTDLMIDGSTTVITRPDAPYDLSDAAAEQWRTIVASMPAEHFAPSHYPMLTQLCRHKVESNRIAQLIEQCCEKKKGKTFNLNEYKLLTKMQKGESAEINRLMRSMRLTHQSLMRPETARLRPTMTGLVKAPWGDE